MSKIEVGEYVRTKEGYLGILIAINKQDYNYLVVDTSIEVRKDGYPSTYLYLKKENIKKHSEQLIDLIEVGDYVNGHRVVNEIWGEDDNNLYFEIEGGFNKAQYIGEKDIQTILTEESYMVNCYKKVGGKQWD